MNTNAMELNMNEMEMICGGSNSLWKSIKGALIGGATGAVTGCVVGGCVAGPAGAAVGTLVGGTAGALAGGIIAEARQNS